MADSVTVKVRGLAELRTQLEDMPPKIARLVLRRGMEPAASLFQSDMAAHVARHSGFLAQNIDVQIRLTRSDLAATAKVGPNTNPYPPASSEGAARAVRGRVGPARRVTAAMVGRFLEFGTRRMKARPFMRPAYEAEKSRSMRIFMEAAASALKYWTAQAR